MTLIRGIIDIDLKVDLL